MLFDKYRGLHDVCDMTVFTRQGARLWKTRDFVELCLQKLLFCIHVFDFTCFYVNRVLLYFIIFFFTC